MKLAQNLEILKGYSKITPILKGYSSDQKFLLIRDDDKHLLRVFDIKELAKKSGEYKILQMMATQGVKCSRPLAFGSSPADQVGYMLLTYIEGQDAESTVPRLSEENQFRIGFEAGIELKKMHQVPAPHGLPDWHEQKWAKHSRYLTKYAVQGTKLKDDFKIIGFIEENHDLMRGRPLLFQHDDYHISNIIVQDGKFAGAIDFNRYDWGDPFHEFLKIGQFSAAISVPFSVGLIKGYFENQEPTAEFWKLYSIYSAMSIFSSVVWTQNTCPDEMPQMLEILYRVLEDHSWFEETVPRWYREKKYLFT